MDLVLLNEKLKKIQADKVVSNKDDLFVISHIRATINNIQAIYNGLDNSEDDFYKSSLKEKLKEFEGFFSGLVVGRLAQMGVALNKISVPKQITEIKSKNQTKAFSSKSGLKSLKDVMKELSSASKNFKQRKNAQVTANLQQNNVVEKPEKDDFLTVPESLNVEPVVQPVNNNFKQAGNSLAQVQTPNNIIDEAQADKDINLNNVQIDIPLNQSAQNAQKDISSSAGRKYIYDLLKSKNK